jgi:ABC-2 type transport system permease protein
MFSSIFSTISIIEDRREGFLLSMLVSPAPRASLVLGKILGAATLAWLQGLIFLIFAPLAGFHPDIPELAALALYIFLIAFTLTAFGFTMAWRMESTSGFHAIMNLVLFPMWIVSGAVFPMATAHGWIKALMWVNPMTYCVSLLDGALRRIDAMPSEATSLAVTAAFGLLLLATSGRMAARRNRRSEA